MSQVNWLKDNGFGGWMIWCLDFDDFTGLVSGGTKYPLLRAINEALLGEIPSVPNATPPPPPLVLSNFTLFHWGA